MGVDSHLMGLLWSFIGAVVGGGFLYAVGAVGKRILHKEVMGFGDVKLLAMIGAFMGWKLTLLTIQPVSNPKGQPSSSRIIGMKPVNWCFHKKLFLST